MTVFKVGDKVRFTWKEAYYCNFQVGEINEVTSIDPVTDESMSPALQLLLFAGGRGGFDFRFELVEEEPKTPVPFYCVMTSGKGIQSQSPSLEFIRGVAKNLIKQGQKVYILQPIEVHEFEEAPVKVTVFDK